MGKVKAYPDWPLMAVLVEHIEGQRDLITHKSIWHLSDDAIKSVCKRWINSSNINYVHPFFD